MASLIRWEPSRELHSVQSELNRLFNSLFDTPTPVAGAGRTLPRRWVPAMDLVEGDGEYILRADLPGLTEKDVSIELQDSVLTVRGERKAGHEQRKQSYYRVERSYGSFARSLTLPEGVDAEKVTATFDNGVLEIHIPKPEAKQPTRIAVTAAAPTPTTVEAASNEPEPTETA